MYKEICPVYIENKVYRDILSRGFLWFQEMESLFKTKWEKEQIIGEKYMLAYTAEKLLTLPPITDSLSGCSFLLSISVLRQAIPLQWEK